MSATPFAIGLPGTDYRIAFTGSLFLFQEFWRYRQNSCHTATYPHGHRHRLALHYAVAYLEEHSFMKP